MPERNFRCNVIKTLIKQRTYSYVKGALEKLFRQAVFMGDSCCRRNYKEFSGRMYLTVYCLKKWQVEISFEKYRQKGIFQSLIKVAKIVLINFNVTIARTGSTRVENLD